MTAIRLGGGASATVILLRNLRLYREEKAVRSVKQCVEMSVDTNYTGNISNTFQPSQMVKFELKAKDLPADATALNWIVNDYWGRTVASGCIGLTGGEVNLGVMPNGYYETRVFPVNGQGRRISNESVLTTIRNAHRIIVVDDNRIVEEGTHEELLAAGGEYAGLYNAQRSVAI